MATIIPAFSSCTERMNGGERQLAERLEQKLDADCLLWYDVPVGPRQMRPDFVLLHPRHGLLMLETRDWTIETIQRATRQMWEIIPDGQLKVVINPLAQARHCSIQLVNALQRDAQLLQTSGAGQGKLAFACGFGVVFTAITRAQFDAAALGDAIEPQHVICQDEMPESVDPAQFQQRLWQMLAGTAQGALSPAQIEHVRWIVFAHARIPMQVPLFDDTDAQAKLPAIMRVMDLQQEQLARSLGDSHHVIHGVAGSGKTMILLHRAGQLARASAAASKPVLVLCYSEPLAVKLAAVLEARGLDDRVQVRYFHKWCHQQLVAFGQPIPPLGQRMLDDLVSNVIRGVEQGHIPVGQYQAVLIDEGHNFAPEWIKLATQMVDPATNRLLLLCDDAQSIYGRAQRKQFSFSSLGLQSRGHTTRLQTDYGNTQQILHCAKGVAAELLTADDQDDDGIPVLHPASCDREGPAPVLLRLTSLRGEAFKIVELLRVARQEGHAWGDMAIICRDLVAMDECTNALRDRKLPHQARKIVGDFNPGADAIAVLTMDACSGLEFAVVAVPGVGQMPGAGRDEIEEARLFYLAATRATHKLIVTMSGDGAFGWKLWRRNR